MINVILKRFGRGFLAGGISSAVLQLQAGVIVHSFEDLKALSFSLLAAFLTGGLMAIDKLVRYRD